MLVRDGNSSPKVKHLDAYVTRQKGGPAILSYHLLHNCLKLKRPNGFSVFCNDQIVPERNKANTILPCSHVRF